MQCRFPRRMRLRKRREFLAVQSGGRKVASEHFLVLVAPGSGRLGITVSKKVGNAVTRNRVKRLIRNHVRTSQACSPWLPVDRDVVVIARRSAAVLSQAQVSAALEGQRRRVHGC